MTTTNAQRETVITRLLDRPGRQRPLILTARERRLVGARIRQLKREVIPPLLRAMQSPNPDSRDREAYHRANNELDWLLEIALHSAGANGSAVTRSLVGGTGFSTTVKRRAFHADLASDEVDAGATQPRESPPPSKDRWRTRRGEQELTETLAGTELEMGRVVPGTRMTAASTGAQVSLWDLRQRVAAAVCFLHERCEPCAAYARELAPFERELRELDAIALAVVAEAGDLALPVWIDEDARARDRFLGRGGELPMVFIVDRYGAARGSFPSRDHAFPPPEEIVATMRHLAMQCPECGVSEW